VLDDGEPETAAPRGAGAVGSEESLEEPRCIPFRDTGAVVPHLEHDLRVHAAQRDNAGRPLAGVPDRVLDQVVDDRSEHASPQREEQPVVLDAELQSDAGALRPLRPLGDRHAQNGGSLGLPESDHLTPLLELAQEEDVIHELRHLIDLLARLPEQRRQVGAGQLGGLEQGDEPGERRPELVRDRSSEGGSELFVLGPRHYPQYRVTKVLIVEDDDLIAEGMAQHLKAAGLEPIRVGAGEVGLARLRYERPDVLVLDLMLPGLDGWSLIETARAEGIGTPIVVVSARGTEHDRVHALQIGADDYLVKPFSMKELVARVQAAARRGVRGVHEQRGEELVIEELRIDPRSVQAFVDGESVSLTPTEFRLLYALALDRGRVASRDELLQRIWGRRTTHRDRTVDVCVRRLREKIDKRASRHTFIQTRYGVGYKLDPVAKS
jgi:DNA-binding response OmpR family regulator